MPPSRAAARYRELPPCPVDALAANNLRPKGVNCDLVRHHRDDHGSRDRDEQQVANDRYDDLPCVPHPSPLAFELVD